MARRLVRELGSCGVVGDDRERVLDAYVLAVRSRLERLEGDDPALLHPARTVIVLLTDVGSLSADALSAAALLESEESDHRVPIERIEEETAEGVADLVRAVPESGDPRLVERLVVAEEEAQLAALAERLDHLRHAHLWDDPARLRRAHREAREAYLPVASRVHSDLARRYRWWCDRFERG